MELVQIYKNFKVMTNKNENKLGTKKMKSEDLQAVITHTNMTHTLIIKGES